MASKDEKLCMATIRNSKINNINWEAVAKDFGVDTANAAQYQWRRVKKRFESVQPKSDVEKNPSFKSSKANTSRKRGIEEMSAGEEKKITRKQPPRKKACSRKVKMEETPEKDLEEEILQDDEEEF